MSLNLDKSTWTRVVFGEAVESVTDRVDNPSEAGVDRYVGLEHLDPGVMTVQRWDSPDKVEAQKLRFQPGDVIFGRRRAYQKKVARADFEGICSAHALVLRAKPAHIHPDFLPVFLSSEYFLDRAISISVGSLSPTVNWRDLKVQEFDLPPLDEQKRIADLLWALEHTRTALKAEQNEALDAKDATFHAWLNTTTRWSTLGSQFHVQLGKMLSQKSQTSALNDGVPYLANINVRWNDFDLSKLRHVVLDEREREKFRLALGDVLVCEGGEIGRAAIWDGRIEECYYQKALHRLRPTSGESLPGQLLVAYLRYLVSSNQLGAHSTGTTFAHLTRERLIELPIPEADHSQAIAGQSAVDRFEVVDIALSNEISALAGMSASLSTEVFGGE